MIYQALDTQCIWIGSIAPVKLKTPLLAAVPGTFYFYFYCFFPATENVSNQKFRLTRLIRWTQHWFRPNQIFPRPPGPSSHRVDLCYTQQLRQLGHVSHFSSITASFLTCALWRHLVIPNPVGPVCHPVGAGEVSGGVHLRSLCGNVFSVKMLKPILVML